jgi:hypothetical protein
VSFNAQVVGGPFAEGTTATLRVDHWATATWSGYSGPVQCRFESVSAELGTDFTTPNNSSPDWQDCGAPGTGSPWSSVAEIPITIATDSETELRESFKIYFRDPGATSYVEEVEVDIVGEVAQFSAEAVAATEDSDVVLNVSSNVALPFEYRVESLQYYDTPYYYLSAVAGADYAGPTDWAALDSSGQAMLPTLQDSLSEGVESFKLLVRVVNQPSTEMTLEADIFDDEDPNDAPVAVNDALTATEDTSLTAYGAGVLANDTDADGHALTAYYASGPTHGTLYLYVYGGFSYTPVANYNGPDGFTYRASDTFAFSNVATVSISVTAHNDYPWVLGNTYSTPQNTPVTISAPGVLANDGDADGDTLTAVLVTGPNQGTLTLNPSGGFTYTPIAGFVGTDSFTYRASDSQVTSNVATVTLTVVGANAPVANPNTYQTLKNTPLAVAAPGLLSNDTDADGETLAAALVVGPAHGTLVLSGNGGFNY